MAWKTKKEKEKKQPGKLSKFRRAFLKATLGGALVFGSYQYYTPEPVKESINETAHALLGIEPAAADVPTTDVTFTFTGENSPEILDKTATSVFLTKSNIMDEWYATLGRHQILLQNAGNSRAFDTWLSQLDHLFGKTVEEKAKGVDALVDRQITYQLDNEQYDNVRSEYWASPIETLNAARGDCEDFAILKYHALRYLNVPADRLYIIAVGAPDADRLNHATLAVDIQERNILSDTWERLRSLNADAPTLNRRFVILDNDDSENGLLAQQNTDKYKLYFVFNETGVWQVQDVQPAAPQTPQTEAARRAPRSNAPGV